MSYLFTVNKVHGVLLGRTPCTYCLIFAKEVMFSFLIVSKIMPRLLYGSPCNLVE